MGSAKRRTKKYVRPPMQWNAERIQEEGGLRKEFGLKNAKEVWKAKAELRRIRGNARKLLALGDKSSNETETILKRIERYGILKKNEERENTLDDILQLDVRSLLERRLQTRVLKKGLALTAKQARQLITHGFIAIDGVKVSVPSYLVPLDKEDKIDYYKKIDISPKVQVEVKEEEKKEEDKGITRPIPPRPEKIEQPKEEKTETPKEEVKETPKEEVKETPKEEVKETPKEEVKETPKEEEKPKEEATEQKESEKKEQENKGESNE